MPNLLSNVTPTEAAMTLGPDAPMQAILSVYPGAQRALFRKYHIGGCASCGFAPEETLATVCQRAGNVDPAEALAWIAQCDAHDRANEITPAQLQTAMRDAATPLHILDIRTREEWDAVRLEGADFFTQELMQQILSTWPRGELIVVYDHLGKRSLDATAYFAGQGFTNVKSLRGGIDAWAAEIDPEMPRYEVE
jgi:rhodanese-related sulfurtransferase